MHRNSANVSTKQKRIAALAKQSPEMAFTSLAYLMDIGEVLGVLRTVRVLIPGDHRGREKRPARPLKGLARTLQLHPRCGYRLMSPILFRATS